MKYTVVIAAAMFALGAVAGNSMNGAAPSPAMVSAQPTSVYELTVKAVDLKDTTVDQAI